MAAARESDSATGRASVPAALWAFVFLAVAITTGNVQMEGDAHLICTAGRSFTDHGAFDVPPDIRRDVLPGPDGRHYTNYPIAPMIVCMPAGALHWLGGQAGEWLENLLGGLVPAAVTATMALLFFFVARRFGCSVRLSVVGALLLVFSTFAWAYGRTLYSEGLQATMVVASVLASLRARERGTRLSFLLLGAVLGLTVHAKTPLMAMVIAAGAHQLWGGVERRRLRDFLVFTGLGGLPFLAVWLWYNWVRSGNILTPGYATNQALTLGFGTPLLSGLHGLLLSPGKSLFLYAPLLLLAPFGVRALWRTRRAELVLLAFPAVFIVCISAKWWAWSGDWCWGPRLILPVVPLLMVPALLVVKRGGLARITGAVLAAAGVLINFFGIIIHDAQFVWVVSRSTRLTLNLPMNFDTVRDDLAVLHYVPEMSPVVGHPWLLWVYLHGGWHPGDWYPWKSLGIPAWEITVNPTPHGLNLWSDGSPGAWITAGVTTVVLALLAVVLWRLTRPARS